VCLLPALPANSVIIDNSAFHIKDRLISMAQSKGQSIIFLLLYSPEFNPIKNFWAWLKAKLRFFMHIFPSFDDALRYCFNVV